MPSGIVKRQDNRFDAVYETPWGGVSSATDPADIPPSCNVIADGVFIKNGRLCSATWNKSEVINYSETAGQNYFSGEQILFVRTIFKPNNYVLVAFSNLGNAYIYEPSTNLFVFDQQMTPFPTGTPTIFDIQVIAGLAYVTLLEDGSIYVYDPFVSYTVATNFVGGKYLTEIIGYLITANTNQPTDTPPVKVNRYNWSAPFKYTTWDPGIDRTAGFNTISEVQDEITGLFTLGNVAYVLRDQGISQLSPSGQALAPFTVTPLWESQFGIGCTYPDTFSQYGAIAIWANDNNVYAFFNGSMPQEITGTAKAAIYGDINIVEDVVNEYSIISGAFFNCSEPSNIPELTYVLSIVYGAADGSFLTGIFWTYNLASKTWTRQVVDLLAIIRVLLKRTTGFRVTAAKLQGLLYTRASGSNVLSAKRITGVLAFFGSDTTGSGIGYSFMFPFFNSDTGEAVIGGGGTFQLQFKQEEVRLGTQPTIRGVILKVRGSGALAISVNGTSFSNILLPFFPPATPQIYISTGMYTGYNPQLTIDGSEFVGVIIKANMMITYEEGEPV